MVFNIDDYVHSGIKDLDYFIGGGFPYGSITLIQEDEFACFNNLIVDCIISNQAHERLKVLYSTTGPQKKSDVIYNLPFRMERKNRFDYDFKGVGVGYQRHAKPSPEEQIKNCTKHTCFDIKKKVVPEMAADRSMDKNLELVTHSQLLTDSFLRDLKKHKETKLLVIVQNLLTVLDNVYYGDEFCKILQKLKSLSRQNPNLCFIVTANVNYIDYAMRELSTNIVDCCLKLRRVDEKETIFNEFKGVVRFIKLPKNNSTHYLVSPEVLEVGIQLKSLKRFIFVQKIEDSPEGGRNLSRCSFDNEF